MAGKINPRKSIRYKLALSYMGIIVIPVMLAGVLLHSQLIVGIRSEAGRNLESHVQTEADLVNTRMEELARTASRFVQLREFNDYLNGLYLDQSDMIVNYNQRVRSALGWFSNVNPLVQRVGVFYSGEHIAESETFHLIRRVEDEDWYKSVSASLGGVDEPLWEGPHMSRSYKFSDGRDNRVYSMYLRAPSNPDYFIEFEIEENRLLSTEQDMLLIGKDGQTLYGSAGLAEEDAAVLLKGGWSMVLFSGDAHIAAARPIPALNAWLVGWMPIAQLEGMEAPARRQFFFINAMLWASMLVFLMFMSRRITRRIARVTGAVVRIYEGDYKVRLPVESEDELGVLAHNTNELAARIDHLINEVVLSEVVAREAELRALQSQINPHFIFNTLETFRMMAELGGDSILAAGLTDMGELMRYNLSSLQMSSVKSELNHVRAYVGIQNLLHNGMIELSENVPDDLQKRLLPRLVMQPIVENAVVHGLIARKPLCITIELNTAGDGVELIVSDNGRGIELERLTSICELLARCAERPHEAVDDCLALVNIQRRLALRYGPSCILKILCEAGMTRVSLCLPESAL